SIKSAFSIHDVISEVNFPSLARKYPGQGQLLERMGFNKTMIKRIEEYVLGHRTVEGAPDLKPEHLPVFDCAVPANPGGRYIRPEAHVLMLAAIQPWISGGISKTCNMPRTATVQDILDLYWLSWKTGVKCLAIYRDGSKGTQPLSTGAENERSEEH